MGNLNCATRYVVKHQAAANDYGWRNKVIIIWSTGMVKKESSTKLRDPAPWSRYSEFQSLARIVENKLCCKRNFTGEVTEPSDNNLCLGSSSSHVAIRTCTACQCDETATTTPEKCIMPTGDITEGWGAHIPGETQLYFGAKPNRLLWGKI